MRREKRNKKLIRKKTKQKRIAGIFYISLFLLIFLISFVSIKVGNSGKFIFVDNLHDDTEIVVVDPQKLKIVKILIPGDTQIKVSKGFGTYKLKSLWELGEKEGFRGILVADSIKKSFLLPIYLWKDGIKTNLNLWQRIRVFLIEKNISNYDLTNINLIDINVLKQKELTDGTNGYIINSKVPESVSIHFADTYLSENISKIELEDLTSNISVSENVSKILGVMGTKITSYTKGFDENLDCEIIGMNNKLVKIISNTFDCKEVVEDNLLVDIKIRLGKRFVDRF